MYIPMEQILDKIGDSDRVLDLGGWERVFPRANVVADLLPYDSRKRSTSGLSEHFTKDTWIVADFCSPTFWERVPDKSFDFITIGHTLEDIRDPLYVCSQMIRCGKGGYIEIPSKIRELSKFTPSDVCSGFSHHRWIIEPMNDLSGLIFKAKLGWAHWGDFLGDSLRYLLNDYFHHFDGFFWRGSFKYIELYDKGPAKEIEDAKWYFQNYVEKNKQRNNVLDLIPDQSSADDGKSVWISDYLLPSEYEAIHGEKPPTFQRYL